MRSLWCQGRPNELTQCPRRIPGIGWRDNWHAWIEWIEFYKNSSKWKNIPFWMTWMTIYSCWKRWVESLGEVLVQTKWVPWKFTDLKRVGSIFFLPLLLSTTPNSVWSILEFHWLNSSTTLMCSNLKKDILHKHGLLMAPYYVGLWVVSQSQKSSAFLFILQVSSR